MIVLMHFFMPVLRFFFSDFLWFSVPSTYVTRGWRCLCDFAFSPVGTHTLNSACYIQAESMTCHVYYCRFCFFSFGYPFYIYLCTAFHLIKHKETNIFLLTDNSGVLSSSTVPFAEGAVPFREYRSCNCCLFAIQVCRTFHCCTRTLRGGGQQGKLNLDVPAA